MTPTAAAAPAHRPGGPPRLRRRRWGPALAALLLLLGAHPAAGQGASAPPASAGPLAEYRAEPRPERSFGWEAARALAALGAVLGLFGLAVQGLKRWPRLRPAGVAGQGELEPLGRLALSAKDAVWLVRAGSEVLVLGVGGSGVTLLHRLAAAETAAPAAGMRGEAGPGWPGAPGWRELAARLREVHAAWSGEPAGPGRQP